MAQNILFNGVVYSVPDVGDDSWGQSLSNFFVAIPQGALQKSGGLFTLTAETNFGANFGLLVAYLKTRASNPSTAGLIRLAVADTIGWRNNAHDGNLLLGVNASDQLVFNGTSIISNAITALTGDVTATGPGSVAATIGANKVLDTMLRTSTALTVIGRSANSTGNVADISAGTDFFVLRRSGTSLGFGLLVAGNLDPAAAILFSQLAALTSGNILVGSAGNVATSVAMSGDITISNAGVTAIGLNKVLNTMIRQSSGLSILGRSANTTGDIADITAGTDKFVLFRSGTSLVFALLDNTNLSASAGILFSQLAALTSGNILVGSSGNVATSVAMSGDLTISNLGVTAIGSNKVTNAMLAQIATQTFKGRTTASTGNVEDLTATQATAIINAMVGDSGSGGTKGLVPAPAAGDAAAVKFLKADGTWQVPAGAGTVTSVALTVPTALFATSPVTGSPVTGSGTLAPTLATQSANLVFAGPINGSATTPTFRSMIRPDISGAYVDPIVQTFTSGSGTWNKTYVFTVTSANATVGATYTNNGQTFTVVSTIASATTLLCTGTGAPSASGTLTKSAGTGDSTITFSAIASAKYLEVWMAAGGGGGGGGGNVNTVAGSSGGDSTFGSSLLTCTGGTCAGANGNVPPAGSVSTIASPAYGIAFVGSQGVGAMFTTSANYIPAGKGGDSPLFSGGGSTLIGGVGYVGSTNSGGGGGGGAQAGISSTYTGAGGNSGSAIWAIIPSPSATYAYAVGAGGAGGGASSNGFAGAAGASGKIIVIERFQ